MRISGHVDLCGPELIEGWLYWDAWEGVPIRLQVFVAGELAGECVADRSRNDLQEAGLGDGQCGFSFRVPEAHASANFAATKLRLLETPMFLRPDEFSNVANQAYPSANMMDSASGDARDCFSSLHREKQDPEPKCSAGKARGSVRTLYPAP
jgi:hypothetical protein